MVELQKNDNKNTGQINKLLAQGYLQEIWGLKKWKNLFAPVDISSQVFFRILFGTLTHIAAKLFISGQFRGYLLTMQN